MGSRQRFREHREGKYRVREISEYIIAHQGICHGQPTFRGTRVLVHLVLDSLREPGQTMEAVARDYGLTAEAVADALRVAADLVRHHLSVRNLWNNPDDEPALAAARTSAPRRRKVRGEAKG